MASSSNSAEPIVWRSRMETEPLRFYDLSVLPLPEFLFLSAPATLPQMPAVVSSRAPAPPLQAPHRAPAQVAARSDAADPPQSRALKRKVNQKLSEEEVTLRYLELTLPFHTASSSANTIKLPQNRFLSASLSVRYDANHVKRGKSGERYALYKGARTLQEAVVLGATAQDLKFDIGHGHAVLG